MAQEKAFGGLSRGDFSLFCLAGAISCLLWLLQRSSWSVLLCLLGMFVFLIRPVWYFPWINKTTRRRVLSLVATAAGILVLGWRVWPYEFPHAHIELRLAVLDVEPFFPYHTGIAKANVFWRNSGNARARNNRFDGRIKLVPAAITESELFRDFKDKASFSPTDDFVEINARPVFKTIYGEEPLSMEDVAALNGPTPTKKMCFLSAVQWEDDTGFFESDLCGCMEPQRHPGAIPPMAFCAGHNGEWKRQATSTTLPVRSLYSRFEASIRLNLVTVEMQTVGDPGHLNPRGIPDRKEM